MSVTSAPKHNQRLSWVMTLLLALSMIGASHAAEAGWLSKLKDKIGGSPTDQSQALGKDEVGRGLKEALRVGTENVVGNLGQVDGFNLDSAIHIPLPDKLDRISNVLGKVGMDSMMTDLELRLNRAAEIATPKAKALFIQAIQDMTLDDTMAIYNGPEDSATRYFRSKMAAPLALQMKPVVDASLADAGAVRAYDAALERYNAVPFAPPVEADLTDYVVTKGMDGIFYYLAKEEAAIRQDPLKQTTDILKRVFGR